MNFRLIIILLCILCFKSIATAQDTLTNKNEIDSTVVFDKKEGKYIYYRDYNDPDFKEIKNRKKNYRKVRLANGETIWFTMSNKYTRFRMGLEFGYANPLGDFQSEESTRQNAGYANPGANIGLFFTKRIYRFVDIQAKFWGTGSISEIYGNSTDYVSRSWTNAGVGIGPNFTFKLSPRFYTEIPILFTYSYMGNRYESYFQTPSTFETQREYSDGNGTGSGLSTGLSLNMRVGQHFAVGLGTNFHYGKYSIDYYYSEYISNGSSINQDYSLINEWFYLTSNIRAVIHF